jgi:hypothetical protein
MRNHKSRTTRRIKKQKNKNQESKTKIEMMNQLSKMINDNSRSKIGKEERRK